MTRKGVTKQADEIKQLIRDYVSECEKKLDMKMDCWVVEDDENGNVEFRFDGTLYQIIEYYFSDGYNLCGLGRKYETLFDGTGWMSEPYSAGIHIIYKED